MTDIDQLIAALDGAQLPGGCHHCDAYQTIKTNAYGLPKAHAVTVHHDDWCPLYRRIKRAN